jgi:hypothetical protein
MVRVLARATMATPCRLYGIICWGGADINVIEGRAVCWGSGGGDAQPGMSLWSVDPSRALRAMPAIRTVTAAQQSTSHDRRCLSGVGDLRP